MKKTDWLIGLALLLSLPAYAGWQLDSEQSLLHFVSVKKQHIAEVHRITGLSGTLNNAGNAEISLPLTQLDSGIAIRDKRMKQWLFMNQPSGRISARVPAEALNLAVGKSLRLTLPVTVDLIGKSATFEAEVQISRLRADYLQVVTVAPIIVRAESLGLGAGIDKLQQLAGLDMISHAVPVTFVLGLQAQK